jgi:hypothetical protein
MNEDFLKLAQKIVKDRGKDILNNGSLTKAYFMDYSHGEYKNEINLLLKTIELGYPNKIREADDLDIIKLTLSRQLTEDHFIAEKISVQIVSLLIMLIRNEKDIKFVGKNERNFLLENNFKEYLTASENNAKSEILIKENEESNNINKNETNGKTTERQIENIFKLKNIGWSIEEISTVYNLSINETNKVLNSKSFVSKIKYQENKS